YCKDYDRLASVYGILDIQKICRLLPQYFLRQSMRQPSHQRFQSPSNNYPDAPRLPNYPQNTYFELSWDCPLTIEEAHHSIVHCPKGCWWHNCENLESMRSLHSAD